MILAIAERGCGDRAAVVPVGREIAQAQRRDNVLLVCGACGTAVDQLESGVRVHLAAQSHHQPFAVQFFDADQMGIGGMQRRVAVLNLKRVRVGVGIVYDIGIGGGHCPDMPVITSLGICQIAALVETLLHEGLIVRGTHEGTGAGYDRALVRVLVLVVVFIVIEGAKVRPVIVDLDLHVPDDHRAAVMGFGVLAKLCGIPVEGQLDALHGMPAAQRGFIDTIAIIGSADIVEAVQRGIISRRVLQPDLVYDLAIGIYEINGQVRQRIEQRAVAIVLHPEADCVFGFVAAALKLAAPADDRIAAVAVAIASDVAAKLRRRCAVLVFPVDPEFAAAVTADSAVRGGIQRQVVLVFAFFQNIPVCVRLL